MDSREKQKPVGVEQLKPWSVDKSVDGLAVLICGDQILTPMHKIFGSEATELLQEIANAHNAALSVHKTDLAKPETPDSTEPSESVQTGRAFWFPWKPPFHYFKEGTWIADSKDHKILDMRGWGFLTGQGGLDTGNSHGLDPDKAAEIQDRLAEKVVDLMNRSVPLISTPSQAPTATVREQ